MEFKDIVDRNVELAQERLGSIAPAERILRATIEEQLRNQLTPLGGEEAEDYLSYSVPLMYPRAISIDN